MKLNIDNTSMVSPKPRYEIHLKFIENKKDGNEFTTKHSFLLTDNELIKSLKKSIFALHLILNNDISNPWEYCNMIEYRAFFINECEDFEKTQEEIEEIKSINPTGVVFDHLHSSECGCFIEDYEVYYFDQYERKFNVNIEFSEKDLTELAILQIR